MVWVVELSLDDVIFELDAKVPMDNFNDFSRNSSYFGFIINNCIVQAVVLIMRI